MQAMSRHKDRRDKTCWSRAPEVPVSTKKTPYKALQTFAKNAPQNPRKLVGGRGISRRGPKALPNSLFVAPGSKDLAKWRNFNVFGTYRGIF